MRQKRRRQEGGNRGAGQQDPPQRRKDRQEAAESGDKTEAEEEKLTEEGNRDGETPRGAPVQAIRVGIYLPYPEKNADLPEFTLEHVHLLLREVYGKLPHHNDGSHLDGGIADNATWQRH